MIKNNNITRFASIIRKKKISYAFHSMLPALLLVNVCARWIRRLTTYLFAGVCRGTIFLTYIPFTIRTEKRKKIFICIYKEWKRRRPSFCLFSAATQKEESRMYTWLKIYIIWVQKRDTHSWIADAFARFPFQHGDEIRQRDRASGEVERERKEKIREVEEEKNEARRGIDSARYRMTRTAVTKTACSRDNPLSRYKRSGNSMRGMTENE